MSEFSQAIAQAASTLPMDRTSSAVLDALVLAFAGHWSEPERQELRRSIEALCLEKRVSRLGREGKGGPDASA